MQRKEATETDDNNMEGTEMAKDLQQRSVHIENAEAATMGQTGAGFHTDDNMDAQNAVVQGTNIDLNRGHVLKYVKQRNWDSTGRSQENTEPGIICSTLSHLCVAGNKEVVDI